KTVNVTIEDPNSGKIFEKDLPLSTRGTFSGDVDLSDEAPLGSYNITAKIGEATSSGYFEVQEYKKPEFKVTVKGPKEFASVGEMAVDFEVPAPGDKEEWDYTYRLEAQVTDASRREMSGAASFTGTRGKTVADAFPERYLYYQGDAAKIRVKTADYSGKPVSE